MIGMDPVDKEAMIDMVFQKHKADFEGLSDADRETVRKTLGMLLEGSVVMLAQARESTINDVLKVFDATAVTNNLKFIREAIEGLKTI